MKRRLFALFIIWAWMLGIGIMADTGNKAPWQIYAISGAALISLATIIPAKP